MLPPFTVNYLYLIPLFSGRVISAVSPPKSFLLLCYGIFVVVSVLALKLSYLTVFFLEGIVESLEAPGSNVTGTSDYLDTAAVINLMFAAKPDTAKVGLLYDIGQDSSATPIAAAKADLDARGVAYSDYTGTTVDEVVQAVQSLIADGVDAVFTPTDNTIMKAELSICELLSDAGIPHYTGADSFALNGAFLGYGVDYANLGVETANMVAEVALEGKKPAELPVRTFDNGCATVNTETCEKLGYKFDDIEKAFAPFCTKVQSIVTAESFDELN